mmetsp:Transcript_20788/g.47037  ORF Transcript_20788/g.47037 Transcript_20788/m.47037 type:complete len:270 (-) Transcript_20788:36-845(-)
MKRSALLLSAVVTGACAFAPAPRRNTHVRTTSTLSVSREEDLELTRQAILKHIELTDTESGGVVDDEEEGAPAAATASPVEAEGTPTDKKPKKKKKPQQQQQAPAEIDVSKLNIVVGEIKKAWEHEEADKLFCEEIDCGEDEPRQIASGLRAYYNVDDLVGRRVCVLANLKARKLVGFPSHGMVLCASDEEGGVVFVDPPTDAKVGDRVTCEGFEGEPATENQVQKKKIFEKVYPDLRTDANGVACYKGKPLAVGGGTCVASLVDAQVS